MPLVAIYNKAGKLLLYMDGEPDQIALNVPKGGRTKRATLDQLPQARSMPHLPTRETKP